MATTTHQEPTTMNTTENIIRVSFPAGGFTTITRRDIESTTNSALIAIGNTIAIGTTRFGVEAWCIFNNGKCVEVYETREEALSVA
jgi:hypothetical protein